MTYVIAWKSEDIVFIVADSATTKIGARSPRSSHSTFGELHIEERGRVVEESAFKIFRWPHLAISCSGDVERIRKFIELVDGFISRRFTPLVAIFSARQKMDVAADRPFEGVAAIRLLGKPRLFWLDAEGIWHWVDRANSVHLGSPGEHIKELVNSAIVGSRSSGTSAAAQLTSILAICQSLTVHHSLMQQGAGGAFSGVLFGPNGTAWQPDIGYLLVSPDDIAPGETIKGLSYNGMHISCVIRDDILFVSSSANRAAIGFASRKRSGIPEGLGERVERAFDDARQVRDFCRYEFVSLISKKWPKTVVVEMAGQSESRSLKLSYGEPANGDTPLIIRMSSDITAALNGQTLNPHAPQVIFVSPTPNPHPSSTPQ